MNSRGRKIEVSAQTLCRQRRLVLDKRGKRKGEKRRFKCSLRKRLKVKVCHISWFTKVGHGRDTGVEEGQR